MIERSGMSFEAATNSMNMLHSCSSIKEQAIIKTNSFELFTCSCNFMTPSINELIRLHYLMKKGILPFSGGYFEQPYKFYQIMEIIEEYCHKKEEQEQKKMEAKSRRKR